MTTIQKFKALRDLDPKICMRLDIYGSWYVDSSLEICGHGVCSGFGEHCEEVDDAIDSSWRTVVDMDDAQRLQTIDGSSYRWTGFMWKSVEIEAA